jgi:amidase
MKTITKDKIVYTFDKENVPVERISSGETIRIETCDCFTDTVTSEDDLMMDLDFSKINPATGPIYVEDAMPGDVLKVEILKIDLEPLGIMAVGEGLGLLGEHVTSAQTKLFPITNDTVDMFGLTLPLTKMIGVIGTAPAGEAVPNGTPDEHGGNMDCTIIKEGSTLYLPVGVEGALFALGDLHALMGDGEISVSGAEAAGAVEVKISVIKDYALPTPSVLTKDFFATLSSAETMEAASKDASKKMIDFLVSNANLHFNEAYMILSAAGKLAVCQVVDPLLTMRMELNREYLDTLMGKEWSK